MYDSETAVLGTGALAGTGLALDLVWLVVAPLLLLGGVLLIRIAKRVRSDA